MEVHQIWWHNLTNKIKDKIIITMHQVCQLNLNIDAIVEQKCAQTQEQVHILTDQLRNEKEHTRLVVASEINEHKLNSQIKITTLESENSELLLKLREKEYLISNINTHETDVIYELKDLILQTMHYKKSNSDLGNDGEELIESLIYSKYTDCDIIDTSGIKNKGDRIIAFDDYSVLIESKNVKQETLNSNMKRYTDQITTDLIKEQNIRVGILVSIRDVTFNGGDYFKLETIQTSAGTMCVIYCSNIKQQPFLLYSAIQLARKLTTILEFNNCDDKIMDTIRSSIVTVNETLIVVSKNQTMLENICESNKLIFTCLEKTLKTLTDTVNEKQFNDPCQSVKEIYWSLCTENNKVTAKQLKFACEQRNIPYEPTMKLIGGFKKLRLSEKI